MNQSFVSFLLLYPFNSGEAFRLFAGFGNYEYYRCEICIQLFCGHIFASLGYILNSGIAGLHHKCMYNFLKNTCFPKRPRHSTVPPGMNKSSRFCILLSVFSIIVTAGTVQVLIGPFLMTNSIGNIFFLTFLSLCILKDRKWVGEGQRGREREGIPSRLRAVGAEPYSGLKLKNGEIVTWAEVKSPDA